MIKIDLEKKIFDWLVSGVTYKEIQERCGWLGYPITIKEIEEIARGD